MILKEFHFLTSYGMAQLIIEVVDDKLLNSKPQKMTSSKQCHLCYIKKLRNQTLQRLVHTSKFEISSKLRISQAFRIQPFPFSFDWRRCSKGKFGLSDWKQEILKVFAIAVEEYFISMNCQANSALHTQSSILITVIIVWFLKHQGLENMCMDGMSFWMEIFHRNFGLNLDALFSLKVHSNFCFLAFL